MANTALIEELVRKSDLLLGDLVEAEEQALEADERLADWEEHVLENECRFYLKEDVTDPPGGGRWNDNKRTAYLRQVYAQEYEELSALKKQTRKQATRIRVIKSKISALYRTIRLLELAEGKVNAYEE